MALTAEEKFCILQHQASTVLMMLQHQLGSTATLMIKLSLVDNDIGRSATATSFIVSAISAIHLVGGPTIGSLSDRFGRKTFMFTDSVARLGWNLFNLSPLCNSIERYGLAAILFHGVLSAGSQQVRAASLDDLFGSRPSVGAQIRARTAFWHSVASLAGPIIGAELSRRNRGAALWAAASVSVLQLPLTMAFRETLPKKDRTSTFNLDQVNPVRNIGILLRSGPGLRGLTATNFIYHLSNGVERTKGDYVMGSFGWSPQDLSYFGSFQGLMGMFSQSTVVVQLLRRFGSAGAFRIGSCFSAAAMFGISQAFRFNTNAGGRPGSKLLATACFLLAHLVWTGGHVCPLALQTITIKQGINVVPKGTGLGELNAALGGMAAMVGVVSPLLW